MSALSIPAALAIALHCAPAEAPAMLVAIGHQESGLETMILRDNTSGQVLRGAGVIEAAKRRIAAGHSVDLGAWQINNGNLSLLGLGVADVFEPSGSGRRPADRIVQPIQHRQPVAGDRKRLRRRGWATIRSVKAASPAAPPPMTAMAQPPKSAPDPFARPSPTGRDLVFTTKGK